MFIRLCRPGDEVPAHDDPNDGAYFLSQEVICHRAAVKFQFGWFLQKTCRAVWAPVIDYPSTRSDLWTTSASAIVQGCRVSDGADAVNL